MLKHLFKIKNIISLIVGVILTVTIIIIQLNYFSVKESKNPYPIKWDVYGYYLYLPATFIYNDLGLENQDWINVTREKYKPSTTFYQAKKVENSNKKIIIYNVG